MKKFVAILAVMMFAILAVMPVVSASADASVDTGYTMYVSSTNGKGVRMRSLPTTDSKVLYSLGEGRPVKVLSENHDNGFAEVKVQINGKWHFGYIMSKYLSKKDPASLKQTFKAVKTFNVKVRTATANGKVSMWDTTSKLKDEKIRDLEKTEKLQVIEESRAWYMVVDANGMLGFVAKAYVTAC